MHSLSGLMDFECAARWSSFRLAARELNKTPAAVSQQVKQLEQALGFQLFTRHPRHITVTEKGRELAGTVSRLLRELNARIGALQDGDAELVLRISATHSFAMKWLVPRMHRFTELHPELDLRVEAGDHVVSLDDGACDVALRYGRVASGGAADLLFQERLVVVHAPELVSARRRPLPAPSPATLWRYPLVYEDTPELWLRLLEAHGLRDRRYDFSRSYSHGGVLVQAAVAGLGVALVPHSLAWEDLERGRLVLAPFTPLDSEYGYRLLSSRESQGASKVQHFTRWMHAEVAEMTRSFTGRLGSLLASS
ncbi:LysR family transcriptional regulator [Myxococcaceae bacterium JPH2]|nr:LysR family transcriptional regulator [Myxococcaceae bacterium JPH2]